MEPVYFPRPLPVTGRAERVNPTEPRRDAGREQAFRRFLRREGGEGSGSEGEPGREAAPPATELRSEESAGKGEAPGPEPDPCRGRKIDIRI